MVISNTVQNAPSMSSTTPRQLENNISDFIRQQMIHKKSALANTDSKKDKNKKNNNLILK